jgi:hypothetical protein
MAGHYWLTDVCQQAIDVWAGKVGSSSFSQSNLVLRADKYSDVGACLCAPACPLTLFKKTS